MIFTERHYFCSEITGLFSEYLWQKFLSSVKRCNNTGTMSYYHGPKR